jgi:hypothetical protein
MQEASALAEIAAMMRRSLAEAEQQDVAGSRLSEGDFGCDRLEIGQTGDADTLRPSQDSACAYITSY